MLFEREKEGWTKRWYERGKRLQSGRDGGNKEEEKKRKIFSEFGSFP